MALVLQDEVRSFPTQGEKINTQVIQCQMHSVKKALRKPCDCNRKHLKKQGAGSLSTPS